MFTMKKFAVLAVAGFMASSMMACGPDDEDDEDLSSSSNGGTSSPSTGGDWTTSSITGTGYVKKMIIGAGNLSASVGSFVDIDGNIDSDGNGTPDVWKQSQVGTHKNDIDLIYDGTNFWTPAGCLTGTGCSLKSAISGSTSGAVFYNVTSAALTAGGDANVQSLATTGNLAGNVQTYVPHGIYFLQTSMDSYALVLANTETNNVLELIVGYIF